MKQCFPDLVVPKSRAAGAMESAELSGDAVEDIDAIEPLQEFLDVEQFLAEHQPAMSEDPAVYDEQEEVDDILAVSWKDAGPLEIQVAPMLLVVYRFPIILHSLPESVSEH